MGINKLKLWIWKWFRPSKYNYYIGWHAAEGFLAGFSTVGTASKNIAKDLEKLAQAIAKLAEEDVAE